MIHSMFNGKKIITRVSIVLSLLFFSTLFTNAVFAESTFSAEDLIKLEYVTSASISPGGQWIAYTVRAPRTPSEKPGGAYSELYLVSTESGEIKPFITGDVSVRGVQWNPEGSQISFIMRRGDDAKSQVWQIPVDGGEARPVTDSETGVSAYQWHPSGKQIAYIASEPKSEREKALEKKGYDFIFYEEDWKHRNLYLFDIESEETEQLTQDITVWSFKFSSDGNRIAMAASTKNLIDYRYMFSNIYLLDCESKKIERLSYNPGKLGNFAFSPDDRHVAYAAALDTSDHAVSQAMVIPVSGGPAKNLTPENFRGHVEWVGWKDNNTVIYRAGEGVETTLSTVSIKDGKRRVILTSEKNNGVIFSNPDYTENFEHFAFVGSTPAHPGEVFYWRHGKDMKRLTVSNPWLSERNLGKQEVIRYEARDGLEIEGLLIHPVGYEAGQTYPLIVIVHGGPESHYSNAWVTRYSSPGQILAGKGYVVFYPNYRASTGYGVEFARGGYNDAAGKEFDDIADGIDYLVEQGIADKDRVGLGGGSYGGFAAAWFASYYTEKVKAACMFVGISDLISKRGTTDIPYEELLVHSGKKLEEMWQFSLERSPVYYAHQSQTAVLIYGGDSDTRVSPSQSIEFYRRLKMNNHPAVRLVQYPGEGHGNRKQVGRIDVLYRVIDWYDWYVMDDKPLDGPMPPLDISDRYGIELPEK